MLYEMHFKVANTANAISVFTYWSRKFKIVFELSSTSGPLSMNICPCKICNLLPKKLFKKHFLHFQGQIFPICQLLLFSRGIKFFPVLVIYKWPVLERKEARFPKVENSNNANVFTILLDCPTDTIPEKTKS